MLEAKVSNDVLLAFRSILTHKELKHLLDRFLYVNLNGVQTDVLRNEMLELIRGNFAQTLKAGNFGVLAESLESGFALRVIIAIESGFFVAHSEKRSLQDKQMTLSDQLGKELQKESNQEQTNVHAVDIRIRCNDHLVVTQILQILFNSQSGLDQIELFVLIDNLAGKTKGVEGFALKAEYTLSLHVPGLGDGSACGISLGYEKRAFETVFVLGVQMNPAVTKLAVVNFTFLGPLSGNFLNPL